MTQVTNLLGRQFGRLTVVDRSRIVATKNRNAQWTCICECGNKCEARSCDLLTGDKKSCGCLRTGPRTPAQLKVRRLQNAKAFIEKHQAKPMPEPILLPKVAYKTPKKVDKPVVYSKPTGEGFSMFPPKRARRQEVRPGTPVEITNDLGRASATGSSLNFI